MAIADVWSGILMLVIGFPFLLALHTSPLPTFYTEFASATGWCVVLVLLVIQTLKNRQGFWSKESIAWRFPPIAWMPLGLGLILAFQLIFNIGIISPAQTELLQLAILYALLGTLVSIVGASLALSIGLPVITEGLAWALLWAAGLGSLFEWVQLFHGEYLFKGIISNVGYLSLRRLFGNMNQPNHQATMVALGFTALIYLRAYRKIPILPSFLLGLLLITGMSLTGSRTAWLHVGLITILTFGVVQYSNLRRHRRDEKRWSQLTVVFIPFSFILINQLFIFINQQFDLNLFNSVNKFKEAGQAAYRMAIWNHAWMMFEKSPWFGVGWGAFSWNQFEQLSELAQTVELANNAHNIILDCLARLGIIGFTLIFIPVLFWIYHLVMILLKSKDGYKNERGVLFFAVGIFFIHSLLEYPLHYLFFWLPLCFMMGLSDARSGIIWTAKPILRVSLLSVGVLIAFVLLIQIWRDYQKVEAMYYKNAAEVYQTSPPTVFFKSYANYGYVGVLALNQNTSEAAESLLKRHEEAIHLMPQPSLVRRTALLYALSGQNEKAIQLILPMQFYFENSLEKEGRYIQALCENISQKDRHNMFCEQAEIWAKPHLVKK